MDSKCTTWISTFCSSRFWRLEINKTLCGNLRIYDSHTTDCQEVEHMRITIENLDFSYQTHKEERRIFSRLNKQFDSGNMYAIMGPSGSGKTTLLKLLSRELEMQSGNIFFNDTSINDLRRDKLLRQFISRIYQDYMLVP
ncbi:ATP-binding cassette domain-containing protein [Alloscardovia theropitheci]|uniref:ATP-binding cassette domain-containing protein n=1 Tax=Alloscardovia theropitheci TaxID=2496842 RepID=A0A4R0QX42_9BIFI|nr:ATP-binding cassette domain-containing protein [Alloscardovia theropitheci]